MYKQSSYVIALFLGTSKAFIDAPASNNLFATGMNGDEDLGQDITMKGQKFHYNQDSSFAQLTEGPPPIPYPAQDAKEGPRKKDWNKGYDAPDKVHVLDPKIVKKSTTFYAQH